MPDTAPATEFGAYLRQQRIVHDLTQERLADVVGCATETIRSFENDRRRPSLSIAQRIAIAQHTTAAATAAMIPLEQPAEAMRHM